MGNSIEFSFSFAFTWKEIYIKVLCYGIFLYFSIKFLKYMQDELRNVHLMHFLKPWKILKLFAHYISLKLKASWGLAALSPLQRTSLTCLPQSTTSVIWIQIMNLSCKNPPVQGFIHLVISNYSFMLLV